jgi:hypothetical protein
VKTKIIVMLRQRRFKTDRLQQTLEFLWDGYRSALGLHVELQSAVPTQCIWEHSEKSGQVFCCWYASTVLCIRLPTFASVKNRCLHRVKSGRRYQSNGRKRCRTHWKVSRSGGSLQWQELSAPEPHSKEVGRWRRSQKEQSGPYFRGQK